MFRVFPEALDPCFMCFTLSRSSPCNTYHQFNQNEAYIFASAVEDFLLNNLISVVSLEDRKKTLMLLCEIFSISEGVISVLLHPMWHRYP